MTPSPGRLPAMMVGVAVAAWLLLAAAPATADAGLTLLLVAPWLPVAERSIGGRGWRQRSLAALLLAAAAAVALANLV